MVWCAPPYANPIPNIDRYAYPNSGSFVANGVAPIFEFLLLYSKAVVVVGAPFLFRFQLTFNLLFGVQVVGGACVLDDLQQRGSDDNEEEDTEHDGANGHLVLLGGTLGGTTLGLVVLVRLLGDVTGERHRVG